jgi:hypothetical protein
VQTQYKNHSKTKTKSFPIQALPWLRLSHEGDVIRRKDMRPNAINVKQAVPSRSMHGV